MYGPEQTSAGPHDNLIARYDFYDTSLARPIGDNMNSRQNISAVAAAFLLLAAPLSGAAMITFDELPAGNANTAITNLYGSAGVTFGTDNSGIWSGLSQGDPGNWDLEGTNGGAFLGNNGASNGNSYVTSIFFSSMASDVSFDVSRSNGSSAGQTLTASAYSGLALLSTQMVLLGAINSWTSMVFGIGGISSLVISGSTAGFSPFGLDNLQFSTNGHPATDGIGDVTTNVTAIPEPGTYAMMLAGLGLMGFVARRRSSKHAV